MICRHCRTEIADDAKGEHCPAAPLGRLSPEASAPKPLTPAFGQRATNPDGAYLFLRWWLQNDERARDVAREEALRATRRGE